MEIEFTQYRVFFSVKPSPENTCPKCAPQLAHTISVRLPSASVCRITAPGISSSKLGHPQCDSNLSSERYNGALHCLQTYVPEALLSTYSPVKGRSVALFIITACSSGVSLLYY